MSTTTNFGIVLAEGTDTFAPLTFNNNAFTLIDQIMKANQDAGITTAVATLENNILTIIRSKSTVRFFSFVATADYSPSNVVTVDGVQVSVRLADGTIPRAGAWVTNQLVLCVLTGTIMNVISASASVAPITVGDLTDLETTDKSSLVNAINELAETIAQASADAWKIDQTSETFSSISIADNATQAFVIPISGDYSNVIPLYARSADSTRKIIPISMYSSTDGIHVIMQNISGATLSPSSMRIQVTFAHK